MKRSNYAIKVGALALAVTAGFGIGLASYHTSAANGVQQHPVVVSK